MQRRIHQLVACYGIDGYEDDLRPGMEEFADCAEIAGLDKVGPDLPPGVPESANQEIFIRLGRDLR